MLLENYRPISKLVTNATLIEKPKFQVIDAHNHLGEQFGGGWINKPISELIDILDQAGIELYVDLDGGWGEEILQQHLKHFKNRYPERFQVFGGVNWQQWEIYGDDFPERAAKRIFQQVEMGAQGLKIWKNLGLRVHDHKGNLVRVNDNRLDPIWQACSELELPVMMHVADPVAFFDPIDQSNERWEELQSHPDWHFPSPEFPTFSSIIQDFADLVERHRKTIFIGAHVGCYVENLPWVSALINRCPNFYVDISARIGELGRQPYASKKFIIEHSERILFGSDFGADLEAYRIAYRFLETNDEYFNYSTGDIPDQGRWFIYGIDLPEDVLRKVYRDNARIALKHN